MVSDRAERRLAAILAADVAGYSRLMGADEEGTLARLTAHRRELLDPAIARHRGRIVKTTGDGLLAEFASVVDAVRCAAEVQAGMAERNAAGAADSRLEFRIGINVGEWEKRADGKQPYRFRREDMEPFAFAGLWEFARIGGKEILSAAIIVGEPNPLAAAVHDRMPVILDPEDYDRWLDPATTTGELRALLKPYPAERMEAYAVSRVVNSVKNDTEECIEGIGEPPLAIQRH